MGRIVETAFLASLVLAAGGAPADAEPMRQPLHFVANRGQAAPHVAYYLQARDRTLVFTRRELTFLLPSRGGGERPHALHLDFLGARRGVRPRAEGRTAHLVSYFTGPPAAWRAGVPTYSRLVYDDLWPGIDLIFSGAGGRLKYEFLVRPGADPRRIRLAYRGATRLVVNASGELLVEGPAGGLRDGRPVSYQVREGREVEVATAYRLGPQRRAYGFRLGPYDPRLPLRIDPEVFVYAGLFGLQSDAEYGNDGCGRVAVDGVGNAYVTCWSTFSPPPGNTAVTSYVAKVNPSGTQVLWTVYLGGRVSDIAVDAAGNAHVAGASDGRVAAVVGPDTSHNGGDDAWVAKIDAAGTSLHYSGFIGGAGSDVASSIVVDAAGNAYVAGRTASNQASFPDGDGFGPLAGPDTTHNGGDDAFVAKVNAAGTALVYAGYVGGAQSDSANGVGIDAAGNAYLGGRTSSDQSTFPDGDGFGLLPGPDALYNGGADDAFVAKVNAAGTALLAAGYVGGAGSDAAYGVAVDGSGGAVLAGTTSSDQSTFPDGDGFGPLPGADTTYNGNATDGFAAKVDTAGALLWASYIGGSINFQFARDEAFDVALDAAGNAYVVGSTDSDERTFPDGDGFGTLWGADRTQNEGPDAFIAKLAAAGTSFLYASFIGGGSGRDRAVGVAVDGEGAAYVAGSTPAVNFDGFPDGDGMEGLPTFIYRPSGFCCGGGSGFLVKFSGTDQPGDYFTLTPCRLIDTRGPLGPRRGPALVAGESRAFDLTGVCLIPAAPIAVVLNVTVVGASHPGGVQLYPTGTSQPPPSIVFYSAGATRANSAVVRLRADSKIIARVEQAAGEVHLVLDIVGYFVE